MASKHTAEDNKAEENKTEDNNTEDNNTEDNSTDVKKIGDNPVEHKSADKDDLSVEDCFTETEEE